MKVPSKKHLTSLQISSKDLVESSVLCFLGQAVELLAKKNWSLIAFFAWLYWVMVDAESIEVNKREKGIHKMKKSKGKIQCKKY